MPKLVLEEPTGPKLILDEPSQRTYGPTEDTWDHFLSKGGNISDSLPVPQRSMYEGITDTIQDRKGFEDKLKSALYMASLTQVDPDLAWNIDAEMSRYLFNKKQMSPGEIMSAAIKNEATIEKFGKAWTRAVAEIDEMPTWFEDVIVNQFASAIASTESAYYQIRADVAFLGEEDVPKDEPQFGMQTAAQRKLLRSKQIDYQKQARLMWAVSKDPQLALKSDVMLDQLFAIAVQTAPYITATTAGTMVAGPMGGFVAGSSLMGNSAYQKAIDNDVPEMQARAIGAAVGLFSGVVESFGGVVAGKYVDIIAAKISSKYLAKGAAFVLSDAIEGMEEGVQEIADITGEAVYKDIDFKEGVKRVLVASAGGVALGGVFGLVRRGGGKNTEAATAEQRRQLRLAAAQEQLRAEVVKELEDNINGSIKTQEEKKVAEEPAQPVEKAPSPPVAAPTEEVVPVTSEARGGYVHRPPTVEQGAARLDDLTPAFGEDIYGINALQYFGTARDKIERDTLRVLQSLKGKPDADVKIYRAVSPGESKDIRYGDWVTVNRAYAKQHGESTLGGKYEIIENTVKANDLTTNADYFVEQGYYPVVAPTVPAVEEIAPAAVAPPAKAGEVAKEPSPKSLAIEDDIDKPELPSVTSARQAAIAEDRKAMGLDEIASPERKAWQTTLSNAKKKGLADNALRIATEVNQNPRALNDEETAGLVIKAARLKNEYKGLMDRIKKTSDQGEIQTISTEAERVEQEFESLSQAIHVSGTEKGRALVSQKLTINQDYDLVSVVTRAKSNKGKALSTKERAKLQELITKLDAATQEIENLRKQMNDMAAEKHVKQRGAKKYSRMSLEQKDTELNTLTNRIQQLLDQGCY
uniref:Uncharacterized protein n=1 Tax=viral metagenome TaxID=1070528 RepID=A0A6M3XFR8_9ZZZZ